MKLLRDEFVLNESVVPCIKIQNDHSAFSALVIHGYGGNKEEMLGLSFAISELGADVYTIDLRGHGENEHPYDGGVFEDVNQIVALLNRNGNVAAIGHSLGGRLALLSKADLRVGISPALSRSYSEQTVSILNSFRKYRVRESTDGVNFEIARDLPMAESGLKQTDLVIYGARDVPEIKEACAGLRKTFGNVVEIANAMHGDIFTLNVTLQEIRRFILEHTDTMRRLQD